MKYEIATDSFLCVHAVSENIPKDAFAMHVHNSYEIIYFVDGNATFVIEDKRLKLHRDDLIIVKPQKYHYIRIDTSSKYERYDITFYSEPFHIDNALLADDFKIVNCANKAIVSDLFKRIDYYYATFERDAFCDLFGCLLKELIYNIANCNDEESDNVYTTDKLMSEILNYININLRQLHSIKQITQVFYISEVYVFKLFKQHLHISPLKYINKKKLIAAQSMIQKGAKPTVACEACGFNDYSTFYKNYLREFGHAPSNDGYKTKRGV